MLFDSIIVTMTLRMRAILQEIAQQYGCLRGIHCLKDEDKKKLINSNGFEHHSFEVECKKCGEPLIISRVSDTNDKTILEIEEKRQEWWFSIDSDIGDGHDADLPSFTYFDPRMKNVKEIFNKLKKQGLKLRSIKSVNPSYDELLDLLAGLKTIRRDLYAHV